MPLVLRYRFALAASLVAIAFSSCLVTFAQSGPGWEVSQPVVRALTIIPLVSLTLALAAVVLCLLSNKFMYINSAARVGFFVLLSAAWLLPCVVFLAEPEQWPTRAPALSSLARALSLLTYPICGILFWLLGFRLVPQAPLRTGLPAVACIVGSTLAIIILVIGFMLLL